jgi:hypothetical protein
MDKPDGICCGTCFYFVREQSSQQLGAKTGRCRRFPPQIWVIPIQQKMPNLAVPNSQATSIQMQTIAQHPPVEMTGLCGEHRQIIEFIQREESRNGTAE